MIQHNILKTFFFCGLMFCLGAVMVISFTSLGTECNCPQNKAFIARVKPERFSFQHNNTSEYKLAILVPFRDRFEELLEFVPHISQFLNKQHVNHHIFVLNQVDRYRFNRASLINVGFLFTKNDFHYIAMHDVDLLPVNDNLRYEYPEQGPLHIASPEFHPKYHYDTFVGGILLVKRDDFQRMNGMSNKYWGWGLEDDEFYVRIKDADLKVSRPKNILTGINNTFRHIHNRFHRKRDTQKCFNQKEVTRKRDRQTGLTTLKYNITKITRMAIDDIIITIVNIFLKCDTKQTPWCDCSGAAAVSSATTA